MFAHDCDDDFSYIALHVSYIANKYQVWLWVTSCHKLQA